jgi:hypothetical protein
VCVCVCVCVCCVCACVVCVPTQLTSFRVGHDAGSAQRASERHLWVLIDRHPSGHRRRLGLQRHPGRECHALPASGRSVVDGILMVDVRACYLGHTLTRRPARETPLRLQARSRPLDPRPHRLHQRSAFGRAASCPRLAHERVRARPLGHHDDGPRMHRSRDGRAGGHREGGGGGGVLRWQWQGSFPPLRGSRLAVARCVCELFAADRLRTESLQSLFAVLAGTVPEHPGHHHQVGAHAGAAAHVAAVRTAAAYPLSSWAGWLLQGVVGCAESCSSAMSPSAREWGACQGSMHCSGCARARSSKRFSDWHHC